jgi:hypothetical protein
MKLTDNKGISIPIVLILLAIMLLLAITIVSVIEFDSKTVNNLSSSEKALHIAEAGYNKYLWLLNDDAYFYKYGESATDGFIIETKYDGTENPEWNGFTKAYEKTEYKSGEDVLGYFKIEVTPPTLDKPVVVVESTGWTADNKSKRTIQVEIHKRVFTNYIVFNNGHRDDIPWSENSKMYGPYFTNGDLYTLGATEFFDSVGYAGKLRYEGATPIFHKEGQPVKMQKLQMPSVNDDLKKWADEDYTFEGRTYILLKNNKLKIKESDSVVKDNIPLPESGVVYVKGDLYITGVLDGRLTIIAGRNIYICAYDPTIEWKSAAKYEGITYADQNIPTYDNKDGKTYVSDDMLGLVTDFDIIIHNKTKQNSWPIAESNGNVCTAIPDLKIQAALYCNTIRTQDIDFLADRGLDLGQIKYIGSRTVRKSSGTGLVVTDRWGNIIANYGYSSSNQYDYRMAYDAPPHFTEPVNSGWEVKQWREIR